MTEPAAPATTGNPASVSTPPAPKAQDALATPTPPAPITDWRAALPEDLRGDKSLEQIKGDDWTTAGPVLAKNYAETKKLVGNAVRVPAPDAPPAEVRAFWDKLGVPRDVSGYGEVKLEAVDDLGPVNVQAIDATIKPAFLKLGFTPTQAQGVLNLYREFTVAQRRQLADEMVAGQDALRGEWAMNFEANVALAQRAFTKYVPKELAGLIKASQLDMHPDFLRAWHAIGSQLAEDGIITGAGVTAPSTEDVDNQITDLRKQLAAANPGSPQHADLSAKLERAYRTRYGSGEPVAR